MKLVVASALVALLAFGLSASCEAISANKVFIDRKNRRLTVVDQAGKTLLACPVGVGKGPLKQKTGMQDFVTPLGDFVVDVVLTEDTDLNAISDKSKSKFAGGPLGRFVKSPEGLADVFHTMNCMDFDHDGKNDFAYSYAFIGLDGKQTGPKLIPADHFARWYSIGIHGTPNEAKAIGQATSEGCIHVSHAMLKRLVNEKLIVVGTPVTITDGSAKPPSPMK